MDRVLLIVSAGRVVQILLAILNIKISTTYLDSSQMGTFFILMAILTYFGLTFISPIGNFLNRRLHTWKNERSIGVNLIRYNLYILAISLLAIPLLYLARQWGNLLGDLPLQALFLTIPLGVYVTTWSTTLNPSLNLLNHRIAFVVLTNLTLLAEVRQSRQLVLTEPLLLV